MAVTLKKKQAHPELAGMITVLQAVKKYKVTAGTVRGRLKHHGVEPAIPQPSQGKPAYYRVEDMHKAVAEGIVSLSIDTSKHETIQRFAFEHKIHTNYIYAGLKYVRQRRKVRGLRGRGGSVYYLRTDLAEALEVERREREKSFASKDGYGIPDSFASADPDERISARTFAKKHGLDAHSVRSRIAGHELKPVEVSKTARGAHLYRAGDIIEILRAYPAMLATDKNGENAMDGKSAVNASASASATTGRKNRRRKWVRHAIGARLRVTNVAGRKWVGLFAGYKGTELGVLKLGEGEVVFARDADIEAVGDDVPVSADDGFEGRFKIYEELANNPYAALYLQKPGNDNDELQQHDGHGEITVRQVIKHRRQ